MSKLLYRLLTLTLLLGFFNSLPAQTQTLRFKPLTSSDDAEQNTATGAVYLNSTDLELGGYDYDFVYKQVVGIRFPNVTIPQGTIITKAYIQFSVDELRAGVPTTTTINIKAQKGNAATYSTTANNISSRSYTSNMAWNPPAWTVADQRLAAQQTPDIKALVIEAMQSGFSSGNALGFCFSTVNNALFTAYSIDRSAVHAPELVIEYAPLSISADKPSGTYYDAFFLKLTGNAGATIRYTADGSTPTATSGVVYTAPIAVKVASIAPANVSIPLNVKGRYIRIQLKGQNVLSLAEVQVMGCESNNLPTCSTLSNLALKKQTAQSTNYQNMVDGSRAVDGNISGNWLDNSVTHTEATPQAWWQVDLGAVHSIDFVKFVPFSSTDLATTLAQTTTKSYYYAGIAPAQLDVPFNVLGRYVRIQLKGQNALSLAEVQVMGCKTAECLGTNIALGKKSTQSSTAFGGESNRATDNNTSNSWAGRYVRVQLKGQNALSLAEVQVMGCEIYTPLPRTKLSNIFINEVSSTGTTEIKNDWIEIYNNNDFEVSLDSVFITDTKGDLKPFMFRNKNLPAKGYTVVEANDTVTSPISTIASMAISAKGETVYLYQQYQGVLYTLDTLAVPALGSNETYGRVKDGTSNLIKMVNPSPRKSNNNGLILLDMVIASRPRGIYEAPFSLTLTAPVGATIRYTLDGTAPTATTGLIYTAPLSINTSTAIRAIATTATGQSKVMTQTYVFPSSVAAKLSMAAGDVSTALKTLPIAVINTPGDFNNITNQFPCSFEYINKFGENKSVQSDAGYGAFGNYSLYTAAKKSYRVSFSSKYGVGNLKYKVFDKTADENYNPAEEFDALDLKAGHDMTGTDISGMMMSDYLVRTLMHKLGSKDVHSRFVHLFFNGQYHGVYALREHFSPDYVEPYYSGDKDNMEYASAENEPDWRWGNSPVQQQGTGELWNSIRTDSNNKNFQALKSKVDLPHLMNMMMVYLLGGAEPEYKSVIGYRYDPKLILFHKDVDAYMNGFGRGATLYKTNLANCAQGPGNLLAMTGISGGTVNREYQTMMKDAIRLAMLQSNSVLTTTGISTVINQASAILTPNMAIDNARWGNISPASFASNVQIMKNDLPKKISDVIAYYRTYNLIHTLEPVTYSKAAGAAAVGEKIFITNPNANTIVYYTTDGTDVVLDNAVSPTAKLYNASTGIVLPIGKTRIRARAYNRVDNFGMYADIEYIVQSPIKITAICYQPNPAAPAAEPKGSDAYEFFNLTNTTTSAVDISNFMITEAIDTFRFPQGTSIAAGETIMMCSDETKYPLVTLRKFKWSKGKLANEGENISFKNAIGTVYNEVKYDTLTPWPYAKGNGLYIRLKSNDLDNSKGANWQAASLNSLLTTGVMALSNNLVFSAEGRQEGAKAVINWVANTSKNIDYFVVEKLDENKQMFEPFETVNVKSLTSSTGAQYYSITDNTPKNDVVIYRVAMVLNDKTPPQYSGAIRLDFSHLSAYTIYPNPAQDFIDIDLGQNTIEQGTIRIMNLVGTTVLERSIEHAKANIRLDLNSIKEGQYIIFLDIKVSHFEAYATHNRAGEIQIEQIGPLTIRAIVITYTKASSVPADRREVTVIWGDGTQDTVKRVNGNGDGVILQGDIKYNVYIGTHTYPGRGSYRIEERAVIIFFKRHLYEIRFKWNTLCDHIEEYPYTVVFKAVDNYLDSTGLVDLKTVQIKVVGPPPEDVSVSSGSGQATVSWRKPYLCENASDRYFYAFSVWRREGSNPFPLDTCNPGLEGKGYTRIVFDTTFQLLSGKYSFVDKDVERGKTYCYRIVAHFARRTATNNPFNLVASLPSQEVCVQLKRDIPLITNVTVEQTDATQGRILVRWTKPVAADLDTVLNPGPYKFVVYRATGITRANLQPIAGATFTSATFSGLKDTKYNGY
ncbi:hypothetical protein GHT06_007389 [Daphnia sinensis]|uniref:LTD domain-containing protein n=1 Tax=Daphnia sinensis TaxID=1820382 RepID=A0AAD5PLK6_9CRUS|nr:hypothetical protein GHT06_007389 [Daphnia sinensis]